MVNNEEIIRQAYQGFNDRNIDAVLQLLHPDVHWPNGWEGGYVNGHEEVRQYWRRQWQELDPIVTPVAFQETPEGQVRVDVHQLIRDLQGNVQADGLVKHVYTFDEGKIKQMVIEKP